MDKTTRRLQAHLEQPLPAYTPNLSDPRVRRRLADVLAWCRLHLSARTPRPHHHRTLVKVFGPTGNELSGYLRDQLLAQSGSYRPARFCKPGEQPQCYRYTLNLAGYEQLKAQLDPEELAAPPRSIHLSDEIRRQLEARQFVYADKRDRRYHPLQNIRSAEKKAFWAAWGFDHHYDLQGAMPTLISQLALQLGDSPRLVALRADPFTVGRQELRQHVAALTGVDLKTAKLIVTALFNGGVLTPYGAIYKEQLRTRGDATGIVAAMTPENFDEKNHELTVTYLLADAQLRRLREDPTVHSARVGARYLWKHVGRLLGRKLRNGGQKQALYQHLERLVIDVCINYLNERGIHHFLEHDGFITDAPVNLPELEAEIKAQTSWVVKFAQG